VIGMKLDEISDGVLAKAITLLKEGKVKFFSAFKNKLVFYVEGYHGTYEVTYDMQLEMPDSCNCEYYTKQHGLCSHMVAVELFVQRNKNMFLKDMAEKLKESDILW
jgi:hypothetical protein